MPKRKLNETSDAYSGPNPKSRRSQSQTARLEQTIENGTLMLHRALKTSRGFERQKLGRRQKTARQKKEDEDGRRLDEEVKALKSLDLGVVAERHLYKQLKKTKRIAESPAFAELAPKKHEEPSKDPAVCNVTARLFNSNPVRDVMPGIMGGIRNILGLDDAGAAGKQKGAKNTVLENGKGESTARKERQRSPAQDQALSDDDISMSDADDIDLSQYNTRLAPSGSESDGGDMDDQVAVPRQGRYDPAADLSLSPSPSEDESEDSLPATAVKTGRKMPKEDQPSSTTFLPSLMMGGYWSGSESGDDDIDGADVAPKRKNRMGQQARRQLWEKKYGSGAKHLQKQKQNESKSRDHGWDARKGASSRDDFRGKRGRGRGGGFGSGRSSREDRKPGKEQGTSSNAEPIGQRKPSAKDLAQKPLHPSWEAAKKTKEQKGQVAFQGKKVVFD
ncbi:hypothetical protein FQN54_001434 [Arachnomyces sp. PD_36]|nr:hypothetical protein FQN54_001434 [Arachnomyces sp. PD_36]